MKRRKTLLIDAFKAKNVATTYIYYYLHIGALTGLAEVPCHSQALLRLWAFAARQCSGDH